jgi:hypothetical protein
LPNFSKIDPAAPTGLKPRSGAVDPDTSAMLDVKRDVKLS